MLCCVAFRFVFHLVLKQVAHYVERVLQRLGIARGTRILAGVEGRHAEDNLFRLRIIGTAIATRCHRTVAHEAVRAAGDLLEWQIDATKIKWDRRDRSTELKTSWLTCGARGALGAVGAKVKH